MCVCSSSLDSGSRKDALAQDGRVNVPPTVLLMYRKALCRRVPATFIDSWNSTPILGGQPPFLCHLGVFNLQKKNLALWDTILEEIRLGPWPCASHAPRTSRVHAWAKQLWAIRRLWTSDEATSKGLRPTGGSQTRLIFNYVEPLCTVFCFQGTPSVGLFNLRLTCPSVSSELDSGSVREAIHSLRLSFKRWNVIYSTSGHLAHS